MRWGLEEMRTFRKSGGPCWVGQDPDLSPLGLREAPGPHGNQPCLPCFAEPVGIGMHLYSV